MITLILTQGLEPAEMAAKRANIKMSVEASLTTMQSGTVWTPVEKKRLVEHCTHYKLQVISGDVYTLHLLKASNIWIRIVYYVYALHMHIHMQHVTE